VLREAVKMLTAKGLLSARPRQGTRVEPEERWNLLDPDVLGWLVDRKYSARLLIQFTQMRLAVEPQAARLAAINADARAHRMIRDALERMIAAERGEDDPLESDIAFHAAILEASGNPFFAQLRDLVNTALRISIRTTNRYKGVRLASIEAHARIAEAIERRQPEQALEHSRALVQEALNLIEAGAESGA
jgi:DNA-binding FadR family transcriptional regulator